MRYPDCQRADGNCSACALSSYGRDCHNASVNQLAYLRNHAGLSQQALADKSGVYIRQIQKVESGASKIGNLTLRNAVSIADALGVDVKDLL